LIKNYKGLYKSATPSKSKSLVNKSLDSKWAWHSLIQNLVTKLNLKPEEVYKMNYIDALNWLSFWSEQAELNK
jgi:hypothetical protein